MITLVIEMTAVKILESYKDNLTKREFSFDCFTATNKRRCVEKRRAHTHSYTHANARTRARERTHTHIHTRSQKYKQVHAHTRM